MRPSSGPGARRAGGLLVAGCDNLIVELFQPGHRLVHQHHARPLRRQGAGGHAAQPAAGPADQDDTALQRARAHASPPSSQASKSKGSRNRPSAPHWQAGSSFGR